MKNFEMSLQTPDYGFLINQIHRNLPTLPTIVHELTNVLHNPDESTFTVEDVLIKDQSMTSKILRIANTTYYRGSRERVGDASEAIGTLGFEKIRNVVLTTSVFKMFSAPTAEQKFSLENLWKHSLGVATASRCLAKYLGRQWHESAYTCGLLHDIGKVARYKLDENDGAQVLIDDIQTALDNKIGLIRAEIMNNSPRHDLLGYYICKNWGLSKDVENVVRWHHESNRTERSGQISEEGHDIVDTVFLANWLVNKKEFGFSGTQFPEQPSEAFLARLQLSPAHIEPIEEAVENDLKLTKDFCDMLDGD